MFSIPFSVQKNVEIDKNIEEVYAAVSNFDTWPKWSPWLCQEPECPVTVSGTPGAAGHRQFWDGKLIGSGEMTLKEVTAGSVLNYDLLFLKPWKSRSQAGFTFAASGDRTQVTWWMTGTLPIFLFFMKKMMSAWVGGDFKRGLSMLKELLETGDVITETQVKGAVDQKAFYYVGKGRACSVAEVGPAMQEDLGFMAQLLEAGKVPQPKEVLSVYHKYDMVSGQCEYTSGFAYDSEVTAPDGAHAGQLPVHRAVRVDHIGPYRHLGNAWMAAIGCARGQHKMNKKLPMYEFYRTNPEETPEDENTVEIFVPVK